MILASCGVSNKIMEDLGVYALWWVKHKQTHGRRESE